MIRLKKILFPTDFSEPAVQAEQYACALAEQFDAELHILNVISDAVMASPDPASAYVIPVTTLEEVHAAVVEALAKVPAAPVSANRFLRREVRVGNPFLEIVKYAEEHDIDLLVIGTHGRTGLAHALLGSTAERIVRKSKCPVMTVHPRGHQFVLPE